MNYSKVYSTMIDFRNQDKLLIGEKHHIIPKCLGGTNEESNIVMLSCREHIFVHTLLWKIHPTNTKIIYAFICMCNMYNSPFYKRISRPSSRLLSKSRKLLSVLTSKRCKGSGNPRYCFEKYTFIHKNTKESVIMTAHEFHIYSGLSRSEVNNIVRYNHKHSKNWGILKKDGSTSFEYRPRGEIDNNKKIICPHCNKLVDVRNFKRWHGDNCKLKTI